MIRVGQKVVVSIASLTATQGISTRPMYFSAQDVTTACLYSDLDEDGTFVVRLKGDQSHLKPEDIIVLKRLQDGENGKEWEVVNEETEKR